MGAAATHLLYLHGFRSSPRSFKAQRLQHWLAAHRPEVQWCCPQLPPSPRAAVELIEHVCAGWPDDGRAAVVGSSLGGWYATVLGIRRGWPTVVMNPAVDPARDLARYIDEQLPAFHADAADAGFLFRREFVDELRALQPSAGALPARCLAIIADGDETLDPDEMGSRYAGATELRVVAGSDHALSDFDDHLPHLTRFLHLQPCD